MKKLTGILLCALLLVFSTFNGLNAQTKAISSMKGDLNNDGVVNTLDVVMLINIIFGGDQGIMYADVNGDGVVNTLDLVMTVNIIFYGQPSELTVATSEVSGITYFSAFCGGNVSDDGGLDMVSRGICWSTSESPTVFDNVIFNGSETGEFACVMTDLASATTYYVRAFAINTADTAYGEQRVYTTDVYSATGQSVDLGLPSGTKWADRNIGASLASEYGNYYSWGETATKEDYSWDTYLCSQNQCDTSEDPIFAAGLTNIAGTDFDAAHVIWGGTWQMPTDEQLSELLDNCTWIWSTQGGVDGYFVIGPNGNCIFLPSTGCFDGTELTFCGFMGFYWTSTHCEYNTTNANHLLFNLLHSFENFLYRYYGQTIRPITF